MSKWISQLARKLGFHGTDLGPPCIVIVRKDDVRMSVYEYPVPSGESGFRIELEHLLEQPDHWEEIASFRDYNLAAAIALLTEAKWCIGNLQREE